jgi:CheY-like chemotaxis protein
VDDKANMRALARDYLAVENFRVVTANNGRDAIFVARNEKPDLIPPRIRTIRNRRRANRGRVLRPPCRSF